MSQPFAGWRRIAARNCLNTRAAVAKHYFDPVRPFSVAEVAEGDAIQRHSARFAERARHTIIRGDASPASSSPDSQPHHQQTPAGPGTPR
jgi:hypothetical protein